MISQDSGSIGLKITLTNVGNAHALEKVQVYAHYTDSRTVTPNYQLCAVASVECEAGETKTVDITVDRYWLKAVLEDGSRTDPDTETVLYVGGHQPDALSERLCGNACICVKL